MKSEHAGGEPSSSTRCSLLTTETWTASDAQLTAHTFSYGWPESHGREASDGARNGVWERFV